MCKYKTVSKMLSEIKQHAEQCVYSATFCVHLALKEVHVCTSLPSA